MSLRSRVEARLGVRLHDSRVADVSARLAEDPGPLRLDEAECEWRDGFLNLRWTEAALEEVCLSSPLVEPSPRTRALQALCRTFATAELPCSPAERELLVGLERLQSGRPVLVALVAQFEAYYRATPLAHRANRGRLARALRISRALDAAQ